MLSKMDLRVQMDGKSGQLKKGSTSDIFSAFDDAEESANGAFEVCLMMIIHLALHLKMHFKIYIKMPKKVHLRMH